MGAVEGDLFYFGFDGGEVGLGLGGWYVAPGAYGVEVGEEIGGEVGGEGFATELDGEAGGEILIHGERDEQGVASGPRCGLVMEEVELYGEVVGVLGDEGVDAVGVGVELVPLVGGECGGGVVGCGADLESALEAVVIDEVGAEDFGEFAGGVAADEIHLEEAVLCGDEALREEEVVEVGRLDGGDALGVACDGDGLGETGGVECSVKLRERGSHGVAEPKGGEDEGEGDQGGEGADGDEDSAEMEVGAVTQRWDEERGAWVLGDGRGWVFAASEETRLL